MIAIGAPNTGPGDGDAPDPNWTWNDRPHALPGLGGGRRRRADDRRRALVRARGRVRHAARRLLRGDDPGARAGVPRGGAGRARRLRDEGVPERRDPAAARRGGSRRGRVDARRAPLRAARGHPGRAARRARQQQVGRGARARRRRRAPRTSSLDSVEELDARARGRRRAHARPHHARDRGGHARVDPHRARSARSSASRRTRLRALAARRRRRCTSTSARSCSRSRRRAETIAWLNRFLERDRLEPARRRPRRRARRADAAGRARRRRSRSSSTTLVGELAVDGAGDPRAGTLARRAGGRDALPRRAA